MMIKIKSFTEYRESYDGKYQGRGNMMPDTEKEFNCRQCGNFYDSDELEEGKCPECETDEYLYMNELLDEI